MTTMKRSSFPRLFVFLCALAVFAYIQPAFAQSPGAGACLVQAARYQIGVTTGYDQDYRRIPYPNGDVPQQTGVCTDVIVRAYRRFGVDLQVLVHEDMKISWAKYPKLWGLTHPDANIDHRRVPNLATFVGMHGQKMPPGRNPAAYLPGDIVTWRLESGVPHIGLVSDRRSYSGVPLIIHNIGSGTREEDILFSFEITGHYRYLPHALKSRCAVDQLPGT